jgi:hypothetical protein
MGCDTEKAWHDIAEADQRKAEGGPVVTHEAFMAELKTDHARTAVC